MQGWHCLFLSEWSECRASLPFRAELYLPPCVELSVHVCLSFLHLVEVCVISSMSLFALPLASPWVLMLHLFEVYRLLCPSWHAVEVYRLFCPLGMMLLAVHPASAGISWHQLASAGFLDSSKYLALSNFSCNKQGSLKNYFIYCALTVRVSINLQFIFVNLSLHIMPGLAQISSMPRVSASHFRLGIWLASMSLPRHVDLAWVSSVLASSSLPVADSAMLFAFELRVHMVILLECCWNV
jgi:hypothetical protein